MFEEAQLYSPVTTGAGGAVTVHLHDGHPGAGDPAYRARRNEIAAAALRWRPGEPAPAVAYSEDEQAVWRAVCEHLAPLHERLAVGEYRAALQTRRAADRPHPDARRGLRAPRRGQRLALRARRRPRRPAHVLRRARRAHVSLDAVRPPPRAAALHARAGHRPRGHRPRRTCSRRRRSASCTAAPAPPRCACATPTACASCRACSGSRSSSASSSRTARLRAYGAGILSSYGEIEQFRAMELRPLDLAEMGTRRLRHHPLPAGPVPGGVRRRDRSGRRRLLRHLHRRIDRGAAP